MGLTLKGYPNSRQIEFFKADTKHIAYGGARGGGKSWAMRRKFVLLAMNYPKLRILLLRRTLPELEANHIMPLLEELHGFAKYNDQKKIFTFPNGSFIKLGYCQYEKDVFQYQGHEYDVIGLEEATHFTETQKDFLTTCNRTTRADFPPRMYYTSNPGNVGHAWFKRLFVDKVYKEKENPEDYIFIPARVHDNTILMQNNPEYVKTLENLPEQLKRAHLYGDWDVFEGQYFPEFSRDIHVVEPFIMPTHWRRYTSMDYGLDMLACYWIAVDTHNNGYVYKELYESNLIISEAAKRILEVNGTDKIHSRYAPPDMWNRRQETGKSAAEIFRENGLHFIKSSNDRVQGWYNVKEWIKPIKKRNEQTGETITTSRLKIFSNCKNLIRALPMLQIDEKDPNDVATEPHELTHAPDALRGWCITRPLKTETPKIQTEELTPQQQYIRMVKDFTGGSISKSFINYGG